MSGKAGADYDKLRLYVSELSRKNEIPLGEQKSRFQQEKALPGLLASYRTALENQRVDYAEGELPTEPPNIESRVERIVGEYKDLEKLVEDVADAVEEADNPDGTFDESDVERLGDAEEPTSPGDEVDTDLDTTPGGQATPAEGQGAWQVAEDTLEEALGRKPSEDEIRLYWQELMNINDLEIDDILYKDTVLDLPTIDQVDGLESATDSGLEDG